MILFAGFILLLLALWLAAGVSLAKDMMAPNQSWKARVAIGLVLLVLLETVGYIGWQILTH